MARAKKTGPAGELGNLVLTEAPEYPRLLWAKQSSIRGNPDNWTKHPADQSTFVQSLINKVGWAGVTLYNLETDRLIDGHLRLALSDPDAPIPVLVNRWTPEEERLILAGLNTSAQMAEVDPDKLKSLIARSAEDFPDDAEIDAILAAVRRTHGIDDDEPDGDSPGGQGGTGDGEPVPSEDEAAERLQSLREKWGVERGQVWVIPSADGRRGHRLACGDSTDPADVERLTMGSKASMVFTSPPYDKQRNYAAGQGADWFGLMTAVFAAVPAKEDMQIFVNLGQVHEDGEYVDYWIPWQEWMRQHGWRRFARNVWDQGHGMPAEWHGRLATAYEFVYHFNKKSRNANKTVPCKTAGMTWKAGMGKSATVDRGKGQTFVTDDFRVTENVVKVGRAYAAGIRQLHPAPYPVGLPKVFIEAYTNENEFVYDPFSGSGATIMACEESGRVGWGNELAPEYVALSLEWFQEKGLNPRKA